MVDHAGAHRTARGERLAAAAVLLLLAPVLAELLATYLRETGSLSFGLFLVVFLAPLYGGASLLIREVALRTGRGWPGRLLLATAFGVAMPTLVDVSLFTRPRSGDRQNREQALDAAVVGGISSYAAVSWVIGHIVMSVGAPLAVVEALRPSVRRRTWIGPRSLTAVAALFLGVALLIHFDKETARASVGQDLVSLVVIGALVGAAFSPWGRPVRRRAASVPDRPDPRLRWTGLGGFAGMVVFDLAPMSWAGVAIAAGVALVVGLAVLRCSRRPAWSWRHVAALGIGAVAGRACIGFLAPVPDGVEAAAKYAQNAVLLLLVVLLGVRLLRTVGTSPAD